MAYNKAAEEKKWRLWKEAEEKRLRRLGVDEDTIQKLRVSDWNDFRSDRRFYERGRELDSYIDDLSTEDAPPEFSNIQDLLNDIANEELFRILIAVDKLTLQIALMRIQGYSLHEIAEQLPLSEKAVYRRVDRLKEKIKKFIS